MTDTAVWTKKLVEPKFQFAWVDVLTLLRAKFNFRFCGTLEDAQRFISVGGKGDAISVMGGFPFVVKEALPHAPDAFAGMGDGKIENVEIRIPLFAYAKEKDETTMGVLWETFETHLNRVVGGPQNQISVCQALYKAFATAIQNCLIVGGVRQDEANIIMVKGPNFVLSTDREAYGTLGKCGGADILGFFDRWSRIYHAENGDVDDVASMIGAIVKMADEIIRAMDRRQLASRSAEPSGSSSGQPVTATAPAPGHPTTTTTTQVNEKGRHADSDDEESLL
ncbi:uncharacterized protein KY384_007985 [Bacidia gigantensis]|uniref:uncharacterized protein n=1 Tax=Bacidia gigantensis TaxID=2732470 RepID=UPI001D045AAD|nr:uncharacterized protein KY384_007985 [Bacidia gigantensis]KAG8527241.1 hypothetical protein KY384_007985 [Bacidia gigantensis]